MTTIIVDADTLVYKAAYANQKSITWGDVTTVTTDQEAASETIRETLSLWKDKLNADSTIVCLSDAESNFRKKVYTPYKAGRGKKPVLYDAMRKLLIDEYAAKIKPSLEADDLLGIYATHPTLIKDKKIMVSEDKDLLSIPGRLYNPGKDSKTMITKAGANYHHLFQTLTGDAVDGYPGIPGIGKVKAQKVLLGVGESDMWEEVVKAYEYNGLTEDDALTQARVARILRASDYNFKRKEPILWSPNQ